MKIKTKLYLSSLIPIILVAILILVKIITLSGVDEQNKQRAASRQTLQAVSELDILTYNYLFSHEKIIEQQWHSKYASLGKSLATLKPDKEEKTIVNRLIQNYSTIGASFSELLADTNESTTSHLVPQFLISSQSMIDGASALVEKNVKDMLNIQTLNDQLILSLGILLLLSGIITAFAIYNVVAKSLHILHVGAQKVGQGNLDYKIDIKNRDEIGQVARTFNKMTIDLKAIIATKADLEKEINKRKNIENTLRESEEELLKFSQAVKQSPASIVITDLKGSIEYVNQGFVDSTGYSRKEAIGKNPRILKSGVTSPKTYQQLWKTVASGKKWMGELCNKKKNGDLYWEQVSISPVNNTNGKIINFLAVKNDITDQKNLDQRKDDFITIAGHELRTPVSAIKIMNQILQDMLVNNPQALKYLKKIENQATIQSTLINDLLSVSKIQTGKLEINKKQLDLRELIKETIEDIQETTKTHKIILKGNAHARIFTDEERVRQVLVNFCSNAVKFSPEERKIVVELKANKEEATVSVTDFGIGIHKTNRDKIFDRFYRVYGSGNKTYPGLGMGLYISYQIIKLLDGKMWFESTPGKGSTFYFSLPFKS
jgi:PAS domain S-box-containing protein